MALPSEAYKQKVWIYLDKLQPGRHIVIDDICELENYKIFVVCVKEWMGDRLYNGGIEFNEAETEFSVKYVPIKSVVFGLLLGMQPGTRYKLSNICHKEHIGPFISLIKAWMDQMPWQGGLSFNADYTEFYMTHIPTVFSSMQNSPVNEKIHHSA
ncbi:hypothetical protein [Draconibacterium sp.]|uniref:hypothetical protein n=1 Tax=Draconibacterium sp. TaxID=1965318 RepID=UPI0035697742